MLKAFAIKGLAVAAALVAIWILPAVWEKLAIAAIASLMIGFFTYAIVHPSSRFFAPVISRLTAGEQNIAFSFDDGPDPLAWAIGVRPNSPP